MTVGHNLPAMRTHTNMLKNNRLLKASMLRLSSGYKINSAKEDAAGLAIANKLSFQIAGLNRASQNASHGVSLVQTADGALTEVHNMLQRMRELAVQAANGINNNDDREKMQEEIDELIEEIQKVSDRTEFNKIKLISGEADRVSASYVGMQAAGDPEKMMAKMLYMSEEVPAGILDYRIASVGLPAQYESTVASTYVNGDDLILGKIIINEDFIEVQKGDTYESVKSKIIDICKYNEITYQEVSGKVSMITDKAGSSQEIVVSGNTGLLAQFGLSAAKEGDVVGTNAAITECKMYDSRGDEITAFNNGMAITTDGNQVTIKGTTGEEIRFNIQVVFQPTDPPSLPPKFTYGDGITDASLPSDMSFKIEDYGPIILQIGANYNQGMEIQIPKLNAETLGLVEFKGGKMYNLINYQTTPEATRAIDICEKAISIVSITRSRLGAFQNRLEATIHSLDTAAENTEASRSLIRDTDMAKEMTKYTQYNVMHQASLSILAQANQRPQQLLTLMQ